MAIMLKCVFQNMAAEINVSESNKISQRVLMKDKTLRCIFKMFSNEAFRTHSVFKLENQTALEFILSIGFTVANYWVIVILICLTCMRDFCEIFIFTIFKIVERVIWTLELTGFEQINEKNRRLVLNRGAQTDLSLDNVTEKSASSMKFKDSLKIKEHQTSPLSQSSVYSQDFISSQHQYFISPQQSNNGNHDLNAVEKLTEAIITVDDLNVSPINPRHASQNPVPTIHLTPCSTIKYKDATVSLVEKGSQTSPQSSMYRKGSQTSPQSSMYSQDSNSSQHQYFISPQQSNNGKHDLNVVDKLTEATITVDDLNVSPINHRHKSQNPVPIIHLTPCSTIKYKDATVSLVEKGSQTSPQSSVYSQDYNSSQHQDFTPPQQNNTGKYDLNVVKEVEKFEGATITVEPSPINSQHMSQSPVCTIHLTPRSSNLRANYSKVLVETMSPEELSYLRRKWNSLKKNEKRPYLKMQPVFPSDTEDSSDERRPKKARMMHIDDYDNKKFEQKVDSPEMNGCYKNLFLKLKSKFTKRNDSLVSYKYL